MVPWTIKSKDSLTLVHEYLTWICIKYQIHYKNNYSNCPSYKCLLANKILLTISASMTKRLHFNQIKFFVSNITWIFFYPRSRISLDVIVLFPHLIHIFLRITQIHWCLNSYSEFTMMTVFFLSKCRLQTLSIRLYTTVYSQNNSKACYNNRIVSIPT